MIILQPVTPTCAASLKAVRLRALQDTPLAFGSTYAREAQLSQAQWEERAAQWDGQHAIGYLAWDGSDVCGIAGCFGDRDNSICDDPTKAYLVSMWVAPGYRRQGVGQQLVQSVIRWAQSRGFQRLYLMVTSTNKSAIRFYQRLGFQMTGSTEPYPNDTSLVEFEMMLFLGAGSEMRAT